MFSRKARRIPWKKSLLFMALVFAIASSATVAVAAQEAWTVIFGTTGNDTISEAGKTGNYRIYGFLGKDTLTAGNGDSVLVGDGHCPPGTTNEKTIMVIPPPAGDPENNADQYCDYNYIPGDGGDTLTGGTGLSAIFGGGGPNRLTGGKGSNYIQDGPSNDVIVGGPSGDAINATYGPSTITPGKGTNIIDTQGPGLSVVNCTGKNDYVYADKTDKINKCAHVYYGSKAKARTLVTSKAPKHTKKRKKRKSFTF